MNRNLALMALLLATLTALAVWSPLPALADEPATAPETPAELLALFDEPTLADPDPYQWQIAQAVPGEEPWHNPYATTLAQADQTRTVAQNDAPAVPADEIIDPGQITLGQTMLRRMVAQEEMVARLVDLIAIQQTQLERLTAIRDAPAADVTIDLKPVTDRLDAILAKLDEPQAADPEIVAALRNVGEALQSLGRTLLDSPVGSLTQPVQ